MNVLFKNLDEFGKHFYLRFDTKYWLTVNEIDFTKSKKVKEIFNLINGCTLTEFYSEVKTDRVFLRIGDLTYKDTIQNSNLIYLDDECEIPNEKVLTGSDLVLATIGATIGKINLASGYEGGTFSNNTIVLRFKNFVEHNPKFYELLFQSNIFMKYLFGVASQKAQPNLQSYDISQIRVPIINKTIQETIVKEIEPIQTYISELKKNVLSPQGIIDKVFAQHFGFDIENADKKKKELVHYASLEDLANEELKFDISLKYRYIFLNYIKNPSNIEWIELGKLVDVKGGKRLPKGQNITEEETDYKYIRVDDLSWSGVFDLENIKYISEENHKAIKNYIAKENDILLTIVGATVGKCGLVPAELDGENITENFARLIIKDKENYLPEYVNYCLQSKTSVYQIDEYKGRGSQGKLALFRIKKIKMPKIGKTQQQEIVDEIKAELDKQELLKQQITTERNKIDKIIEECIMTAQ